MSAIADRERTIGHIVRLRRAERSAPGQADVAAVRSDLEAAVGRTVPRAMAARLLSISQTALERWIRAGAIPVVLTPGGRHEVPLRTLLELMEELESRRASGEARPLSGVLRRRDAQAERLDVDEILPAHERRTASGHRRAELAALAYHRAVAQRLDPLIVDAARERLRRWSHQGAIDPGYAEAWARLLELPLEKIAHAITDDDPRGSDLRQNSPFAGTLTEQERRRVLRALE